MNMTSSNYDSAQN